MDAKTIPQECHNIIDLASQAIILANNRSVEQIEKLIMALREFIKPSSVKPIASEQQNSKDNEYLYYRMLRVGHLDDLLAKAILTALHGNRPIGQISKLLKALQKFKNAPSTDKTKRKIYPLRIKQHVGVGWPNESRLPLGQIPK